jgi:GNAT superfamily N-acetyltransferase
MVGTLRLDDAELDKADLEEAAGVASRAFVDDAYFRYLLPNDRTRARSLTILFRGQIAHLGDGGRIVTVRGDHGVILGVSAWLTTGHYPLSLANQLAQVPSSLRALIRRPRSLQIGGAYLKTLQNIHPKDPHWYLLLLVADPAAQRVGVGTMLMEEGLARADKEHVASYLETQKVDNHAYYRRFGYELRDTVNPVAGGPPYYTMWRAPR